MVVVIVVGEVFNRNLKQFNANKETVLTMKNQRYCKKPCLKLQQKTRDIVIKWILQ